MTFSRRAIAMQANLPLAHRGALVTGGSRGIGLAIAQALAQHGASVAILSRSKAAQPVFSLGTSELCPKTGLPLVHSNQRHTRVCCDVRHSGSVPVAVK